MIYNPKSDLSKKNAIARFDKLINGSKPFELTSLAKRSTSQNSILHVYLSYLGLELGYTMEYVKLNIWKMTWLRDMFYVNDYNKKTGEEYKRVRSSAELTVEEMTTAIKVLIEKASTECGVIFPEKNSQSFEDDFTLIQSEVYKNQQYL